MFRYALLATVTLAASAGADVVSYAVSRYASYTQTSSAPPATPQFWSLSAVVYSDVANEVQSGTISYTMPPLVTHALGTGHPHISQYYSSFHTDYSAYITEFPATTYTLAVDRGFGTETGELFLPEDLYCAAVPHFTGDTFDRLQSFDASAAFGGTINGFTPAAGTNTGWTDLVVVENGVPGAVWLSALQPGDTAFQIPAGQLLPSRTYSISVVYGNAAAFANGGFNTATAEAQFLRDTTAYFTTLPDTPGCEPCDANCDGSVNGFDIQNFVDALSASPPTPCSPCAADTNADGSVNGFDIQGFVECLGG